MSPETRRQLIVLWVAFLVSISLFYVIITQVPPESTDPASPLPMILLGLAVVDILASFWVRTRLGARPGETRTEQQVRAAHIASFALSEAAAIMGVVAHFAVGWPNVWIFLVLGGFAMLLNYPRAAGSE